MDFAESGFANPSSEEEHTTHIDAGHDEVEHVGDVLASDDGSNNLTDNSTADAAGLLLEAPGQAESAFSDDSDDDEPEDIGMAPARETSAENDISVETEPLAEIESPMETNKAVVRLQEWPKSIPAHFRGPDTTITILPAIIVGNDRDPDRRVFTSKRMLFSKPKAIKRPERVVRRSSLVNLMTHEGEETTDAPCALVINPEKTIAKTEPEPLTLRPNRPVNGGLVGTYDPDLDLYLHQLEDFVNEYETEIAAENMWYFNVTEDARKKQDSDQSGTNSKTGKILPRTGIREEATVRLRKASQDLRERTERDRGEKPEIPLPPNPTPQPRRTKNLMYDLLKTRAELEQAQERCSQLERNLEETDHKLADLKCRYEALQELSRKTETDMKDERNRLTEEISQYETEAGADIDKIEEQKAEIETKQADIEVLQQQIRALNANLQSISINSEANSINLQRRLDEARTEIAHYKDRNDYLEAYSVDKKRKIEALKLQKKHLADECDRLQGSKDNLHSKGFHVPWFDFVLSGLGSEGTRKLNEFRDSIRKQRQAERQETEKKQGLLKNEETQKFGYGPLKLSV
ncbi:hypothetical protein MBLNU459_g1292t1 [Dothideomycetes sp. NU459]